MTTRTSLPGIALRWAAGAHGAIATPALSILAFHRVHETPDALFPNEMDARRLDRLLALLASSFRVVTLGQAVTMLEAGCLRARTLVITFDDGYADNAEVALPILRRHGLAATFFVATGFLDGGRMWNDTVIESLRRCARPHVDLGEFGLGVMPVDTMVQRRSAIDALLPKVKYLSLHEREAALHRISALCGAPTLPQNVMMRSDQVIEMHRAGMEIGGHTVHHPILTELPDEQAEFEMAEGRRVLQRLVDAPIDVFAYPNGRPGRDYDQRHVAMARRVGFHGAVSSAAGAAAAGADFYQLPRFAPWDRSMVAWSVRLLANLRRTVYDVAATSR